MSGGPGTPCYSYNPVGWSLRAINVCNIAHSEIALRLPLPSLPVLFGAMDPELCLFDDQPRKPLNNRSDLLAQAGKISDLLRDTDISYLNLKNDANASHRGTVEDLDLCCENLRYNLNAFECNLGGMELDLEEMMGAIEDVPEVVVLDDGESEPEHDQRNRKRKMIFDVSSPSKQAHSLPERSLPSPVRAQSPARSDNVACAMVDSKRDLIGMRSELVKLRGKLREAKTEAGKAKEDALKMGEELKAAKEETARALVAKEKAEEALERSHERETSLKSEMEEQMKAVESFSLLVARLEQEKEEAKEVGKEEYLRSVDFQKCIQTHALPVLSAGMKVGICQAVKKFRHLIEFAPDLKDSCGVKIGAPPPYSSPEPVNSE